MTQWSLQRCSVLNELISKVVRDLPEYRPTHYFEAAIKVYRLVVVATIMEQHDLPIISRYLLKAIDAGLNSPRDIARFLGVDESDLAVGGAVALSSGLMTHNPYVDDDGQRRLMLTEEGATFLKRDKKILIPARQILYLEFNPLTETIAPDPIGRRDLLTDYQIQNLGSPIIHKNGRRPSPADVSPSAVRAIQSQDPDTSSIELLDIVSIANSRVAYKKDVHVFVMQAVRGTDEIIAAYRGFEYLPHESAALNDMRSEGSLVIPQDAIELGVQGWSLDGLLAPDADRIVRDRVSAMKALFDIQAALVNRSSHGSSNSLEEIAQLKIELESLKEQIKTLDTRLQSSQIEFLATEDHRHWLMKAFEEADKRVIVISPWIDSYAIDDQVIAHITSAVDRGVKVEIGYGITPRNPDDAERNDQKARPVIHKLRERVQDGSRLGIHKIGRTHEKILICDDKFGINGSFNWLSYRGNVDSQYRRETSTLLRNTRDVERLARIAEDALSLAQW